MTKYKTKIISKGALKTKAIEISSEKTMKVGKKYQMRKEISENVFDLDDSVADNAKMISLLMTMMRKVYDALPDKSVISNNDIAFMDYAFNKHKNSITLADKEFAVNGNVFVDKLIDRQVQIKTLSDKI